MALIQPSPDLQNALAQAQPDASSPIPTVGVPAAGPQPPAATGSPQPITAGSPIPTVGTPLAGTPPPPEGGLGQTIARNLDKNPVPAGPGGWAKSILAATQQALAGGEGIEKGLGDTRIGANPVETLVQTMNARNQRLAQEKAANQEQANKDREFNARQTQQDVENKRSADLAASQIQTANLQRVHTQALINVMGTEAQDKSVAGGKELLAAYAKAPVPATVVHSGLNNDEMNSLVAQGKLNGYEYTAIPSGTKVVSTDESGIPKTELLYDVVTVPQSVPVTPAMLSKIQMLPEYKDYNKAGLGNVHMDGALLNTLVTRADNIEAAADAVEKASVDAGFAKLDRRKLIEASAFGQNGEVNNALVHAGMDPVVALHAMMSNGSINQKYPNLFHDFQAMYGAGDAKEGEKRMDEIHKTMVEDATKRAGEELKKKTTDIPGDSSLTGEAYIASLPKSSQGNVRAVGEGRLVMSPRQLQDAGGQTFSDAVQQAYPDFDEAKGKKWAATRNEYMGSGATAKKKISYNTSLEHMQRLYDTSTKQGLLDPLSKDWQDRQAQMAFVSNEVGNAIKNGVMTQKEGEEITAGLSGGLASINPDAAKERVAETARLLHDKIAEYQTAFNEGAPSSAVKVPILISPQAQSAYDYIQNGGVKPAAGSPAGSVAVTDPNGGVHTFPNQDAANKFKAAAGIK